MLVITTYLTSRLKLLSCRCLVAIQRCRFDFIRTVVSNDQTTEWMVLKYANQQKQTRKRATALVKVSFRRFVVIVIVFYSNCHTLGKFWYVYMYSLFLSWEGVWKCYNRSQETAVYVTLNLLVCIASISWYCPTNQGQKMNLMMRSK